MARPEVPAYETDQLISYLEQAPIFLAARGYDRDVLDAGGRLDVPLTYHTDGTWIWSGSVGYYLREHGVPPEPELVAHIRATGFRVPEVGDQRRDVAVSVITGAPLPDAPESTPVPAGPAPAPMSPAPGSLSPATEYPWPIEPLPGEPPASLFHGLEEEILPAGTGIDRHGDPHGNVVFAVGTPYAQRSLPAEWSDRPYHVYLLQRPLRVLTGRSIPWFDQPGGGIAHILPVAIRTLLADGTLVEAPTR